MKEGFGLNHSIYMWFFLEPPSFINQKHLQRIDYHTFAPEPTQTPARAACLFVSQAQSPYYSKLSYDSAKEAATTSSHFLCSEMDRIGLPLLDY